MMTKEERAAWHLEYRQARQEFVNSLKDGPCADCGNCFPPEAMDFDHMPGEKKFRGVANMLSYALDRLMAEIEKCELVCSNCHRIRTKARLHE